MAVNATSVADVVSHCRKAEVEKQRNRKAEKCMQKENEAINRVARNQRGGKQRSRKKGPKKQRSRKRETAEKCWKQKIFPPGVKTTSHPEKWPSLEKGHRFPTQNPHDETASDLAFDIKRLKGFWINDLALAGPHFSHQTSAHQVNLVG